MQRIIISILVLNIFVLKIFSNDQYTQLIFEAEKYVVNKDAFQPDKDSTNKWNLWSKDKDADLKWSEGVVLRSPTVNTDRKSPEEGAPPLHVQITGIPAGKYAVEIKIGRLLAVSLNGTNWTLQETPSLGTFEIKDGTFDIWVDDYYASAGNIGPSYFDYVTFTPVKSMPKKKPVSGFAKSRIYEKMDHGFYGTVNENREIYLGWRLLNDDNENISFNIYRKSNGKNEIKLNKEPVKMTTDFVDKNTETGVEYEYSLKAVTGKGEEKIDKSIKIVCSTKEKDYFSIKLGDKITFQKVGIADLDGDGAYDFVIKYPDENTDPGDGLWIKGDKTYKLEAYTGKGKKLWTKDLGWSIERGIWYSPYVVYDFDGDGKAEIAVKTGTGDPRGKDGKVETGPEYLSILDGMTGREKTKINWLSREIPGEKYKYNYSSRNQLCVAYLDGKTPAVIMERGTYTGIRLEAYQYNNNKFTKLWDWYGRDEENPLMYKGQGAHTMHAADIDNDGRDEIIIGSAVVDDNGVGLWSTSFGHPDCTFVGDLDPARPGLEIFFGIEPPLKTNGLCMADAKTGNILWGLQEPTNHVGAYWMTSDIDILNDGAECHAADIDKDRKPFKSWLFSASGKLLSFKESNFVNMSLSAYWDNDLQRELILNKKIKDYHGGSSALKIEGRVAAIADIYGDWREEIITTFPGELRIYSTNIPAQDRRISLTRDPIYRMDVAQATQGYYCIPTPTILPSTGNANMEIILPETGIKTGENNLCQIALVSGKNPLKGKIKLKAENASFSAAEIDIDIPAFSMKTFDFTFTPQKTVSKNNKLRADLPEANIYSQTYY